MSDLRQEPHHSMILLSINFCDKYHICSPSPSNCDNLFRFSSFSHNSDRFELCISSLKFGRQHFIRFSLQIRFIAPVDFFRSTLLIRCIKCVTRSFDLRFALHSHLMSMDPASSIRSPFSVGFFSFGLFCRIFFFRMKSNKFKLNIDPVLFILRCFILTQLVVHPPHPIHIH